MLHGKTRILVTHGISFLPQVDQIIVLSGGTVSECGTYKELLHQKGAFAEFLLTYLEEEKEEELHDPSVAAVKEEILEEIGEDTALMNAARRQSASSLRRVKSVLRQASLLSESGKLTKSGASAKTASGEMVRLRPNQFIHYILLMNFFIFHFFSVSKLYHKVFQTSYC